MNSMNFSRGSKPPSAAKYTRFSGGKEAAERAKACDFCQRQTLAVPYGFQPLLYRIAKLVYGVPIACRQHGLKHDTIPLSATTKISSSATR